MIVIDGTGFALVAPDDAPLTEELVPPPQPDKTKTTGTRHCTGTRVQQETIKVISLAASKVEYSSTVLAQQRQPKNIGCSLGFRHRGGTQERESAMSP